MPTRRAQKVAEAVREVVSLAILADLKDPRIRDVTVTYVEVSNDLRHAKVHVSVMGDEPQQQLSLRGLRSAAGFLQGKVSDRVNLRYTPRLNFVLDQGVKKSIEIARILDRVLPPEPAVEEAELPAEEEGGEAVTETEDQPSGEPSAEEEPPA